MVSNTFRLIFFLKKPRNYESGPLPIYLRITVDGRRAELATKRACADPGKWLSASGRISGTRESVRTINAHLDALQNRVFKACRLLLQGGEAITAEKIKHHVLGVTDRPRMLLEVFQQHNEQIRALLGRGYSPLTYHRYETVLRYTREFLQWKYRVSDRELTRLSYKFLSDYEFYLRSVRRCAHNSTVMYLSNFKKVVLECVKRGWLVKDPFYGFSWRPKKSCGRC